MTKKAAASRSRSRSTRPAKQTPVAQVSAQAAQSAATRGEARAIVLSDGAWKRRTGVLVRATKTGYYDHARRREGDVFRISSERHPAGTTKPDPRNPKKVIDLSGKLTDFSENWMELVPEGTTEKTTTARDAMRQRHDEILAAKRSEGILTDPDADARSQADPLGAGEQE